MDLDVTVVCSTGTYVRALARDLGAMLGVGGSLTRLRRTRVGPYDLSLARTLDELAEALDVVPLAEAVTAAFPTREVDAESAARLVHGGGLAPSGRPGPVAVLAVDGTFLALVEDREGWARPLAVFAEPVR